VITPISDRNDAAGSSRTACDPDGVWPAVALARWESEGGALRRHNYLSFVGPLQPGG
jgi:hypothetical protein